MRTWFLPALLIIFTLLSVLLLSSIAPSLASRQLTFFFLGYGIFFFVSRVAFGTLLRYSWLAYALTCSLLVLVLVLGEVTRNTARWISIGDFINIQPSQLAIPLVGLAAAHFASIKNMGSFKAIGQFIGLLMLPGVLILVEPDLGSTVVFLASVSSILFLSETRWQHLAALVASGVVVVALAWTFVLQPYQRERIFSFSAQERDLAGAGYNARQSLIAVGSGGLFGTGLGQGIQSHLRFLPERQTDFIFASFAEEFGFFGSILLVGLYASLIFFCLHLAQNTQERAARYYCYTIASMLLIQSGVNISMNMGLLPITGVTLPLLSYGGSSLLTIAGSLGIMQSLAQETHKKAALHLS
jgi:rod shape determining protein RodA